MATNATSKPSSSSKTRRAGAHNDANIVAVVGASGMGKGRYIKTELLPRLHPPYMVWSPLEITDKYAQLLGTEAAVSFPQFAANLDRTGVAVMVPGLEDKRIAQEFALFCRAAWEVPGATVIVEELSRVTTASYAPSAWKNLSTAGRHRGLSLIGTCQRPAQVDKDFFGNCTGVRCFRLNYENDAKVMAGVLRVPWEDLMELQKFHYFHRDLNTGKTTRGALR